MSATNLNSCICAFFQSFLSARRCCFIVQVSDIHTRGPLLPIQTTRRNIKREPNIKSSEKLMYMRILLTFSVYLQCCFIIQVGEFYTRESLITIYTHHETDFTSEDYRSFSTVRYNFALLGSQRNTNLNWFQKLLGQYAGQTSLCVNYEVR